MARFFVHLLYGIFPQAFENMYWTRQDSIFQYENWEWNVIKVCSHFQLPLFHIFTRDRVTCDIIYHVTSRCKWRKKYHMTHKHYPDCHAVYKSPYSPARLLMLEVCFRVFVCTSLEWEAHLISSRASFRKSLGP